MQRECAVCDLPYKTRKEIEGMLEGGWTPEDLEHWIALRFRLKISPPHLHHHYEYCLSHLPPGRELWEVARAETGLILYSDLTHQLSQQESNRQKRRAIIPRTAHPSL